MQLNSNDEQKRPLHLIWTSLFEARQPRLVRWEWKYKVRNGTAVQEAHALKSVGRRKGESMKGGGPSGLAHSWKRVSISVRERKEMKCTNMEWT